MRVLLGVILALLLTVPPLAGAPQPPRYIDSSTAPIGDWPPADNPNLRAATDAFYGLQGFFTENLGQVCNRDVRFYAQGDALSIGLSSEGLVLMLWEDAPDGEKGLAVREESLNEHRMHVVNVLFAGGAHAEPKGVGRLSHTTNSFVGGDPSRWVRGASSYQEVWYEGLYDGIDLRFRFAEGRLKYEAEVQPGADPRLVGFIYNGVERLEVDPVSGELLIHVEDGVVLRDKAPYSYQQIDQARETIYCSFKIAGARAVHFDVGSYKQSLPLTIDPGLCYGTYIGSTTTDQFLCSLKARDGSVYLGGETIGGGFPVTNGSLNTTFKNGKGLIVKMDSSLTKMLYATYFGGEHPTSGFNEFTYTHALGEKPDECLVVSGTTVVDDFPVTPNAIEPTFQGATDVFILMLSKDGSDCLYCSYFGGEGTEFRTAHILDDEGNLYLYGRTDSHNLDVTQGAYCTTHQGIWPDVYVVKLDPTLTKTLFCTFFGGSDWEDGGYSGSFYVDEQHCIYIAGDTKSSDLPTTEESYCTTYNSPGYDVFIAKLNANASQLLYCTYLGGSDADWTEYISMRADGTIVIVGETSSDDFPLTSNAIDTSQSGSSDTFIAVLDLRTSKLVYCTFFGGNNMETRRSAFLDRSRDVIHIMGLTYSKDLPTTKGCYNPKFSGGGNDLFILSFDLKQNKMKYCTYIGGGTDGSDEHVYYGSHIDLADDGSLIITAETSAEDFPTTSSAFDDTYNGGQYDGVLFRLDPTPVGVPMAPRITSIEAGDGEVSLQWEPVVSEEYVILDHVIMRGDDEGTMDIVGQVREGTNFTDRGLKNGHEYYYRVAAENSAGIGERSEAFKAVPMGVPSAPLNLTLCSGNDKVELNWSAPDDNGGSAVLGYHVMKGLEVEALEVSKELGPVTNWTDSDVELGKIYFYALVAFNEVGNGTLSEVKSIKVTTLPSVPAGFRVEALPGAVHLAWDALIEDGGSTLLGFHVLRGSSPDAALMTVIATLLPTDSEYTDRAVENGTLYYYALRAYTLVGNGPATTPLPAVPLGPPGAPVITSCVPGDSGATLEWSPPDNDGGRAVTRYALFAGPGPGALAERTIVEGACTSHIGSLENGVEVFLAVRAWNEIGWGSLSEPVRTTPYGIPGQPRDFDLRVSIDGVLLSWREPAETGGASQLYYRIERGTSAQGLTPLFELEGLHEYLDRDVQANVTYYYRVTAINPLGIAGEPTDALDTSLAGLPGPVASFRVVPGDGKAFLSWDPPAQDGGSPVERYVVKRALPGRELRNITEVENSTSLVDEGLVNWQAYRYVVVAINRMGAGTPSEMLEVVPMNVPGAPWDLSASAVDGNVQLKWSPPIGKSAPVTGYIVRRGSSPDNLLIIAEVGQVLEYTDADVGTGGDYYYTITANSTVGEGAQSVPIRVEPRPAFSGPIIYGILVLMVIVIIMSAHLIRRRRMFKPGDGGG